MKVIHTESSIGWGGQEKRILKELVLLKDRGIICELGCRKDAFILKKARELGFQTRIFKFSPFHLASDLIKILKAYKEGFCIIHSHSNKDNWLSIIASHIARITTLRTRHVSLPVRDNPLSKFLFRKNQTIITTSLHIKLSILRKIHYNPQNIYTIPTWIEHATERKDSVPTRTPTLFSVSILRHWKGHKILIISLNELSKIAKLSYEIIGDGPQKTSIIKLINRLKANYITLKGFLEEPFKHIPSNNLLIHPSIRFEGIPQAIIQGIINKNVILASNTEGVKEVAYKKTAFVFDPQNSLSINSQILKTIFNPAISQKVRLNAIKNIKSKFNPQKLKDKTLQIYNV